MTGHGSVIVHGRSDSTLNRDGVRMGSADIYQVVEQMSEVRESLVLGVEFPDGAYWMPLFVVLADDVALDDDLRARIRTAIREAASPNRPPWSLPLASLVHADGTELGGDTESESATLRPSPTTTPGIHCRKPPPSPTADEVLLDDDDRRSPATSAPILRRIGVARGRVGQVMAMQGDVRPEPVA